MSITPPRIVLVEPQMGENIGGSARAMMNCGLRDLTLVAPRDGWPNPKAQAMAAHAGEIIDAAVVVPSLSDALADCHWVIATTARGRDMNKPVLTPRRAAAEAHRRIGAGQRIAVLFGRESVGLSNEEVAQAHAILTVPLDPANTSLNLAQAVLLFGYEWFQGISDAHVSDTLEEGGLGEIALAQELPASGAAMENFLARLVGELDATGFLGVPEKREKMIRNIRAMFMRGDLTDQELQTLHGIVTFLRTR